MLCTSTVRQRYYNNTPHFRCQVQNQQGLALPLGGREGGLLAVRSALCAARVPARATDRKGGRQTRARPERALSDAKGESGANRSGRGAPQAAAATLPPPAAETIKGAALSRQPCNRGDRACGCLAPALAWRWGARCAPHSEQGATAPRQRERGAARAMRSETKFPLYLIYNHSIPSKRQIMKGEIHPYTRSQMEEYKESLSPEERERYLKHPKDSEVLFTTCTKYYPDGIGGFYPVKKVVFDKPVYNPMNIELHGKIDEALAHGDHHQENGNFWKKSYNRARQKCYDYIMCNPDLDVFATFTVDPQKYNSFDYDAICKYLQTWLSNRVQRNGLKYILVPEKHQSGAIHFHGIMNRKGLSLESSGYFKVGKYTLKPEQISKKKMETAQEIYNIKGLELGFSTALMIEGESSQEAVSKYIWKYMGKQCGQQIGGRFFLHGGKMEEPKLVFSNDSFYETSEGVVVGYGDISCRIETFNTW